MMDRWEQVAIYAPICTSFALFLVSGFRFIKLRKLRKQIQPLPVITQSEIGKQDKNVIIKTMCLASKAYEYSVEVGSNQLVFGLHLRRIQERVRKIESSKAINNPENGIMWVDKEMKIKRMPKMVDIDLLKFTNYRYQSVFSGPQQLGSYKKLSKYTQAFLSLLAEGPLIMQKSEIFSPLFRGPHWATLTFTLSLATDIPFVLYCQIKEGQLLPKLAGLSKQNMIDFISYNQKIEYTHMAYQFMVFAFIGSFFLGPLLGRVMGAVRRWRKSIKQWWKKGKKGEIMDVQVDEECRCIVCYQNCRNIIFSSCKHMLVCKECLYYENNMFVQCPYCRKGVGKAIEVKKCHNKSKR